MARAVATLEGDSTSLVKAIKDAQKEMTDLEVGGKALSKQLKDVATEADKAAGALVNKIGGQTAIKAIAGVTAGFAAAQTALGVFSSSMSAFAATQGEAGAKAMADLDMALNQLQGQLFTAVMGTDDMEEITQTLISGIQTLTSVVEVLLTPLRWMGQFLKLLRDFQNENSTAAKKHNEELVKLKATQDQMKKSYDNNQTAIEGNLKAVRALTGATEDGRKASLRAALTATDAIAAQVKLAEKEQDIADYKRLANADEEANERMARQQASDELAQGKITAEQFEARSNLYFNNLQTFSRKAALATVMVMSEATRVQLESLGAQRQVLAAELLGVTNQMKTEAEGVTNTPTIRTGGGDAKAAREAELAAANATMAAITASREAQMKAEEELLLKYGRRSAGMTHAQQVEEAQFYKDVADKKQADALVRFKETQAAEEQGRTDRAAADERFEAGRAALKLKFGDASEQEIVDYNNVIRDKERADQAAFDAARQRAIELHDLTFNLDQTAAEFADAQRAKEKAAHDEKVDELTAGFQEYGKLAGDQLAQGEKASVVAEKLAKKALGAQISALGDKAMVEAAIYAAAFNPMAIPMAAAGVAAYTAAAYLGAEGKKATTATPASAAPAAAPVNTAFNLRVDAAFADGESIARQFAMMQRSAQRRGLVPVGA